MAPKRKRAGKPKPPPKSPDPPPVGRDTITTTNGSQFTVVQYPQPKGRPHKADRTYGIVEDTSPSTAAFITLPVPPQKYDEFWKTRFGVDPVIWRPLPPAGSFVTLRYTKGGSAAPAKTEPQDQHVPHGPPGDSTSREVPSKPSVETRASPVDPTLAVQQQPALAPKQQATDTPTGPRHSVAAEITRQASSGPPYKSQASGELSTISPQAPSYSPVTPAESTISTPVSPTVSLPLQQHVQQEVGAVTLEADLPRPSVEQLQPSSQVGVQQQPATSESLFAASLPGQPQGITTNLSGRQLRSRSRSATPQSPASPVKKRKIVRLKVPTGYILDENMAAVRDPNDVLNVLKGVVDDLYDVQSKTHGFIPETQNLLIDKISDLTDKLAHLKDLTDPQISPNNPIHNVRIAPEIVDYVDEGRNPDIFTREFVENVQRGNAVINGKKQAFKDFSVIYAQKLKEGIGGVDRQVDRIMHNAGLDKELEQAMKKPRDADKDSGKETENGEK